MNKGDSKDSYFKIHGKNYFLDYESLYIFTKAHKLRLLSLYIVEWFLFEKFIMLSIFLNSIVLALHDYSDLDNSSKHNKVLTFIGDVFTIIFIVESVLKIVSFGFVLHRNAYLRDWWNIIDFTIVVTGTIELMDTANINLKSLRILRVLRPLKSINAVPTMRKLI
jgi:hypothetical protein